MPRPRKQRFCRRHEGDRVFKPRSIPLTQLEEIHLELSELEAIRLCDLEGLDQEGAAQRMGISRGSVQRLLKCGREKLIRAVVDSAALIIEEETHYENLRTDRN